MIAALRRKGRQVARDPVLRRWLTHRLTGRAPGLPSYRPGHPPYLESLPDRPAGEPGWQGNAAQRRFSAPRGPISIPLAGETITIGPDDPAALFSHAYDDLETMLSAHRFAWVPVAGDAIDPDWVAMLWDAWTAQWSERRDGWPWHPYTAAERAINIIDFAERHGLPGEPSRTVALLAAHGAAIASGLEYFGEHNTSNHLSNNGRGLLRIGCALGLPDYAAVGARIMVAEAERIFTSPGVLREGSTHYHLLLARNYIDAWLAARSSGLADVEILRDIAARALSVSQMLRLPGGLPLIGDISPDCPPDFLASLADAGGSGWVAGLPDEKRSAYEELATAAKTTLPASIAEAGWHRFDADSWTALYHVPPDGWPPMPGHGHQDLGSFELHWNESPLFVDPGRGSYRDTPDAQAYISAANHNGLMIDGAEPAPTNRPYYSESFRRQVTGKSPKMSPTPTGYRLDHGGFSRLPGVGDATREWRFGRNRLEIIDRIIGTGEHTIHRSLCTPHRAIRADGRIRIETGGARFVLSMSDTVSLDQITRWTAYGLGEPATRIKAEERVTLPCERTTILDLA